MLYNVTAPPIIVIGGRGEGRLADNNIRAVIIERGSSVIWKRSKVLGMILALREVLCEGISL